jgi:hypothetical protein
MYPHDAGWLQEVGALNGATRAGIGRGVPTNGIDRHDVDQASHAIAIG